MATQQQHVPRRKSSAATSPWQRLSNEVHRLHTLKTQHQYLGRYSIEKLCAFHHYQSTVSAWRVALILLCAPLPPFLVLLLMDVVPMRDPREGAAANGVAFARSVVFHAVLPFMILLSTKQALQLSDRHYSFLGIARIGLCVSIAVELVCISLAFIWRFPVPFREVTAIPLFVGSVVFFNWWFGKEELRRKLPKLRHYVPMVTCQLSTYYCFLCLAAAFAYLSLTTQIILVAVFPFVKVAIKRVVWSQARKLDDLSTDVTICFVELTGALYQTVCLQYAKSQALQLVILLLDAAQALYEVRAYVFHEYITDGVSTVQTAVRIVISGLFPGNDERNPTGGKSKELAPELRFALSRGNGSSVFMKPKMIKTMQTLRLLDLNQYRYEVDTPSQDPAPINGVEPPATEVKANEPRELTTGVHAVSQQEPNHLSMEVHTPGVPICSVHDANSQGRQSSTATIRGDAAVRSSAAPPAASSPPKRQVLPPLQHKPSKRASLGLISLHEAPPRRSSSSSAFSVYDPVPLSTEAASVTRSNSILTALTITESMDPANAVARTASIKHRKSKRGSALIHPGESGVGAAAEAPPKLPPSHSGEDQPAAPAMTGPIVESGRQPESHRSLVEMCNEVAATTGEKAMRVMIDGIAIERKDQARVLEQTLQLLFSCEVLVFAEFFEVVLPSVYGMLVGGLWPLHNARYNLLFIGMSREDMLSAVTSSFVYAALESLSMCLIAVVMKRRYGISVFHLLGFILEKYWRVLYGKLTGALIVVWLTLTVHQGVDFTFTYDYGVILERFGAASRWA